jgi:hypothetical protein
MASKPIDLPPVVARAFVQDMRAFFATTSSLEQNEIAARQVWALNNLRRRSDKRLRITDVKRMFHEMRDG